MTIEIVSRSVFLNSNYKLQNIKFMKVTAIYNGKKKPFKSCAALVRWAETNNLFITKNLSKDFTTNTSNVIFMQKDGSKLEVSRSIF